MTLQQLSPSKLKALTREPASTELNTQQLIEKATAMLLAMDRDTLEKTCSKYKLTAADFLVKTPGTSAALSLQEKFVLRRIHEVGETLLDDLGPADQIPRLRKIVQDLVQRSLVSPGTGKADGVLVLTLAVSEERLRELGVWEKSRERRARRKAEGPVPFTYHPNPRITIHPVRACSKVAKIIDLLAKPGGCSHEELQSLMSPKATVRGVLQYDVNALVGYGITFDGQRYRLMLPPEYDAPLPHTFPQRAVTKPSND